jgi:hypothetical protein
MLFFRLFPIISIYEMEELAEKEHDTRSETAPAGTG